MLKDLRTIRRSRASNLTGSFYNLRLLQVVHLSVEHLACG